jgi:hypothetical protein
MGKNLMKKQPKKLTGKDWQRLKRAKLKREQRQLREYESKLAEKLRQRL